MIPASRATQPAVLSLAVIPEHELVRPIASGAYGQVWLARNRLGVCRAVKIVHRATFDHDRPFEREFAGIKAFEPISRSHDGLVDLLQVGRDDAAGYFYYVMELADNLNAECKVQNVQGTSLLQDLSIYAPRTLASELKRRGRLPLDECIAIGLSLVEALAHLHRQGLVHRDIKPSNIIFVGGVPKLADVGLVVGLGQSQSFVGTEGFIAPEGPGTPQADLYSLGIVLYVLSTGKSHQDFPEPLSDLPAQENHAQWLEFDAVVHKACQVQVGARYQSAEEMRNELGLLQRGLSVKSKRVVQRRWRIASKLALATLAVTLLLTSLQLFKLSRRGYAPKPEADHLYQLGRWHYSQLTPQDHAKALTNLMQAIEKDPNFIQPYGELAALYAWNNLPGITNEQIRSQKVLEIANKALALNPNAAEGHIALSWWKFLQKDWRGAEAEIQRAIQISPGNAIAHGIYCGYLSMQGRIEDAHREGKRAQELEPPSSARLTAIIASWPFIAERRLDLAIAQLRRVLELDSTFARGYAFLGSCYEAGSNYVAAIEAFKTSDLLLNDEDRDELDRYYRALRDAFEARGQEGYLRKRVELLLADGQRGRHLAGCYARLGEKEKALAEIEAHFNDSQEWQQIKFLPMYDTLHDDPRFKALVRRAGLEP